MRNAFLNDIKQARSPVTVIKLSPTPKGILFYNASSVSTFITSPAPNVDFNVDSNVLMSIKNMKSKTISSFDVRGAIKLLFQAEEVNSYGEQKYFREAILYDDEDDHVGITIWENLLEAISEETMYLFQNIS